jgi:hypothetical protein
VLSAGQARTQYFGTVLAVTAVTVPLPSGGTGSLRLGLESPDGRTTSWLGPARPLTGRTEITFPAPSGPRSASAIVLLAQPAAAANPLSAPPVTVGGALVRTAGQGTYRVDGSLRDIMTPPRWHFVGVDSVFAVFSETGARGRAWVTGDSSATARVTSDSPWGDETIRVETDRSATLVRSVQFSSGWQATITGGHAVDDVETGHGARARPAVVRRFGLLQAVTVPAGVHLVHFTYRPWRAYEGLGLSALGVLVTVALACWPALARRRRHRGAPLPADG